MAVMGGVRAGGGEGGGGKRWRRRKGERRKEEHSSHCVTGERGGHRSDTSVTAACTEGTGDQNLYHLKKEKDEEIKCFLQGAREHREERAPHSPP